MLSNRCYKDSADRGRTLVERFSLQYMHTTLFKNGGTRQRNDYKPNVLSSFCVPQITWDNVGTEWDNQTATAVVKVFFRECFQ